jgi:UDP-N-acetylmuramyl tripeptide synthase
MNGGSTPDGAGERTAQAARGATPSPVHARRRLPVRTRLAVSAGRLASRLSRATGYGSGGMIGGRIALKLAPQALERLSRDRTVVLVTGTNGKTTTSLMVTRALEAVAPVAANSDGANMPDGALAALAANPGAPYAVLEVDETYLSWVAERVRPAALVLLNLSRDQLDRVGEVRSTERDLRGAVRRLPHTVVVANCDDVLITSVARDAARPVWVSTGQQWHEDAVSCPRCGRAIHHIGPQWRCECGLARPVPHWVLCGDGLTSPGGQSVELGLTLPGPANRANAAMALAAAASAGVPLHVALDRLRTIDDVGGRYRTVRRGNHDVRLLLAKNPAGWAQTLTLLAAGSGPIVIAVNGREADGRDLSWLWDVPFEQLHGRPVIAAGERTADLGVRLCYAEVRHTCVPDPVRAVESIDPSGSGGIDLVANYTAFRDLTKRFEHGG